MPDIEWIVVREVTPHADGAHAGTMMTAGARPGETDDGRLLELRRRVREGWYDTSAAVEQVARRLLASHDL